jgi:hypothetical protein
MASREMMSAKSFLFSGRLFHLGERVLEGLKMRAKELERLGDARHRTVEDRRGRGYVSMVALA